MIHGIKRISSLLVLVVFITVSVQAQQGKMRRNAADRNFNPATIETIAGTIAEITNVNTRGMHIKINTDKGVAAIHLGPQWFLKEKIALASGDKVQVTGSKVTINGQEVIIAKSISKGNVSVQLRDDTGIPLWAGKGKNRNR